MASRDFLRGRQHFVPKHLHGQRLDLVLEAWWPGIRRAALRNLILDGSIRVNGQAPEHIKKVREGDLLILDPSVDTDRLPKHRERRRVDPEARPEVLHEDDACLVLDKPHPLAAQPDTHGAESVQSRLAAWFGEEPELLPVHRLDRGTSGILLLAKGKENARKLEAQLAEGRMDWRYLAMVRGNPTENRFACEVRIGRTMHGGLVRIGDHKGAREACTEFTVLERFRRCALLEARPLTHRMHQIRAHLMWIRLPLCVDEQYGRHEAVYLSEFKEGYRLKRKEKPIVDRMSLHAATLRFVSPDGDRELEVQSPLPRDLAMLLDKLRRYDSIGPRAPEPGDLHEDRREEATAKERVQGILSRLRSGPDGTERPEGAG